ncbi:MAG TPA: hypothetical protein VM369_00100 [Candidatus Binatia bacterium]|nr:hypothetical protein [Candidatus Binatia bacterium]
MNRTAAAAAMAVGVLASGCAAAAKQTYQPTDTAPQWLIEGRESGLGQLTISINGTPVIQGKVSIWSGEGDFSGSFEGKNLRALCSKAEGSGIRTRCALQMDGQKITTLHFKVL